jgi:hypothetical protein
MNNILIYKYPRFLPCYLSLPLNHHPDICEISLCRHPSDSLNFYPIGMIRSLGTNQSQQDQSEENANNHQCRTGNGGTSGRSEALAAGLTLFGASQRCGMKGSSPIKT